MKDRFPTVIIENITPLINGGRYPVKRVVGEDLVVEADVFKDGHDTLSVVLKWRIKGSKKWHETPMRLVDNDRWRGVCSLYENAVYEYTVEAWGDGFQSWREEYRKKFEAGIPDLMSEMLEGAALVEAAATRAQGTEDSIRLFDAAEKIRKSSPQRVFEIIYEIDGLLLAWPDRALATEYTPRPQVRVDRERAAIAAWYEFFPRSAEGKPDSGSTFRDCLPRVDDAKSMGFDVIYFPPVHPIGYSKRKGRNNAVTSQPGEPGVPYAIGNRFQDSPNGGGHRDIAPELGTLEDFDWLVEEILKRDMEVALDFAINCSPDHPWVHDHPEWFYHRPDGTIKYAENPPKKYEDIYPLNFQNENWRELWEELTDVILFWCARKVRIFRVDNPHTKPVAFWEYLIGKTQKKYPDAIFLSEAFTKPKMMRVLAKAGFTQSYTYFTWRNSSQELTEYFTELTQTEMKDYFRANLWPNTPDILPVYLQHGGRPAFQARATLAATLSPVYGIYSGFELCENTPIPGREEYLDSEKYQFKGRDWNAPGNIKEFITTLNLIRRENRALQGYRNLRFHAVDNPHLLCYSKTTSGGENLILIVVNLDPHHSQSGWTHLCLDEFGLMDGEMYQAHDLLSGERYLWQGAHNFVELHPQKSPAHIFRLRRWLGSEQNYDYFACDNGAAKTQRRREF